MPLTKKDYLWGETGTQTTPSTARQQSGWVAGEQPTVGDENWIQYVQDLLIQELQIGDSPETTFKDLSIADLANAAHTWGNSWPYPWATNNTYSASTTADTLESLCLGYVDGAKRIFVLETATGEVQVFNPQDVTLDFTISNATLVAGLPATAGAWVPISMCTDGEAYLFITFEETGGTARHYIQAYHNDGSGVHSGWPSTGSQLASGFLNLIPWTGQDNRTSKSVYDSGSGIIATLNSWVGAVYSGSYSATDPVISYVDSSNGSVGVEGAGDIASVANFGTLYGFGGLTLFDYNGTTYLAFSLADTTNYRGIICTETFLGGGTGSGGTAWPLDLGANGTVCQSMYFDGRHIWLPTRDLTAGGHIGQTACYKFDALVGSADSLNSDPDYPSLKEICGDGISVFVTTRVGDNPGGAHTNTKHNTVLKLNAIGMYPAASSVYSDVSNDIATRYNLEEAGRNDSLTSNRDTIVDYLGPMLFDGRDVWVIQDIRDGATYSFGSKVLRIPRTAIR